MTRALILCPGPSLADAVMPLADLTIAVNRAIQFAACDWWVFGDWQTFEETPADPFIHLCTTGGACKSLQRHRHGQRLAEHHVRTYEDLLTRWPTKVHGNWTLYSVTAAVVLAADLGATSIELIGCDMIPAPDWDGHTGPRDVRDAGRWERERGLLNQLQVTLAERGCELEGIPDGQPQ